MFLKTTVSQGRTYLQIIKSYRDKNGNVRHKVISSLGRADKLAEAGLENIILALQKYVKPEKRKLHDISTLKEKRRVNYGYIVYKKLWNKFSFPQLFERITKNRKIEYDFEKLVFSLVINRLIIPSSKYYFYNHRDKFIEYDEKLSLESVYRSLDILSEKKEEIEEEIFNRNVNLFNMEIDVVFYDVTTYHFESQMSDEIRDYGFSKANKVNEVQVVMGLLIDKEGRPIGYELFRGNTFDGKTMTKTLKKLKEQFNLREVIIVADKGINSKINLKEIKESGFDYIVSSRIKNMPKEIEEKILSSEGYKTISREGDEEYRYKVIDYENRVRYKDEEESKYKVVKLQEKMVCTYSSKRAAKDLRDRQRAIEKAEKTIREKKYGKLNEKKGYKRFIKVETEQKAKGEISLDEERIERESRFDGYSALQYSRLNLSAEEVIEKYHELYKIEESFKVLKTTMQTRPIYLRTKEHIEGHFIICFLAFLLERELEFRLRKRGTDYSTERIKSAIKSLEFSEIEIEGRRYFMKGKHEKLASKILAMLKINQPPNLLPVKDVDKYIAEQII
jgi:transposase